MEYQCPKCGRYGMEWDGRAKVLICYFKNCNHIIHIENQKEIPSKVQIMEAIENEKIRAK